MSDSDPSDDTTSQEDEPPSVPDEGARTIIMARRQFFITSALAGVALTGCDDRRVPPHVCLEIAPSPEPPPPPSSPLSPSSSAPELVVPSAEPAACLEFAVPPPTPAASGAPSATPSAVPQRPRICLDFDVETERK